MKYAAILKKQVDFDIGRGPEFQREVIWFSSEGALIQWAVKYPEAELIRYENISLKLVPND